MGINEIIWRISQKNLALKEKRTYRKKKSSVISKVYNEKKCNLVSSFDKEKMFINYKNTNCICENNLWLFDKYDYKNLKNKWNSGFNTTNQWNSKFAYDLSYKQNDFIGDARTNWELNRHFQFTILSKIYFITKEEKYLDELKYLFYDWNKENPFLIGISWTSIMEISIRAYSWMMTLVFLQESFIEDEKILRDLKVGIINMVDYTNKHHSRY